MPLILSGRAMRTRRSNHEQPSMRAASSTSLGTRRRKDIDTQTAKGMLKPA